MSKIEVVKRTYWISKVQDEQLQKISDLSLKSKNELIREAIKLLIKSPGGEV